MDERLPIIIGVTGGSGAAYTLRLLEVLTGLRREVHVVASPAGAELVRYETGVQLMENAPPSVKWHAADDFAAPIACGSFLTAGMVVCPCSNRTLGAIASGHGDHLVHRAADVHLKERRPLILVHRETPLSLVHIENMRSVTMAGAVVLPASPGFYHRPTSVDELIDFVVARILDQLRIPHSLVTRWGQADNGAE